MALRWVNAKDIMRHSLRTPRDMLSWYRLYKGLEILIVETCIFGPQDQERNGREKKRKLAWRLLAPPPNHECVSEEKCLLSSATVIDISLSFRSMSYSNKEIGTYTERGVNFPFYAFPPNLRSPLMSLASGSSQLLI
jgi:hypothetical protein